MQMRVDEGRRDREKRRGRAKKKERIGKERRVDIITDRDALRQKKNVHPGQQGSCDKQRSPLSPSQTHTATPIRAHRHSHANTGLGFHLNYGERLFLAPRAASGLLPGRRAARVAVFHEEVRGPHLPDLPLAADRAVIFVSVSPFLSCRQGGK